MHRSATVLAALLIAASTLGGCDAKDIPATATPSEAPAAATPQPADDPAEVLALGDAKLFEIDKPSEAVEIAADGSVRFAGEVVGTLSADGKMTLPDGLVMMEVQADGTVTGGGKPTGLMLSDKGGSLRVGEDTATVVFNEDGTVSVDPSPGPGAPAMGHEGCGGAMAKTCALVMFGMVASTGDTEGPTVSPASVEAAPPPSAE